MTIQVALLLIILAITAILFISEKLRPDLIAILVLLVLGLTNLVTPRQVFSGMSSPAVILLLAVYIMTGALFQTGVSSVIGRWLLRAAGENEARLVAFIMIAAGGLSLLMNNIASGAVLMPAIMDVTRRTKISPSKLLLPMAYATQLAGMATLFTTSNIVASGVLQDMGLKPFRVLDFAGVGGLAALAGIAYMVLVGRRLLPDRRPLEDLARQDSLRVDLVSFYQMKERLHEVHLKPTSRLVGQSLVNTGIGSQLGLTVMAIERNGRLLRSPSPHEIIRKKDVLLIAGRDEVVSQLAGWDTQVSPAEKWPRATSNGVEMLEVLPAPHSGVIGQTIKQLQFRNKYNLNIIAVWRNGRSYRTLFSEFPLQGSEVLLVYGPRSQFQLLENDPDWLVLRVSSQGGPQTRKMSLALVILGISLLLAILSDWPIHYIMFTGALCMVLSGCLSMDEAYRAIDWRSVFLVGGMLPVGFALSSTGTAGILGNLITHSLGGHGPLAVVAGLFLVTSAINQFIPGGSAVPAVLTPIAVSAATGLNADPRAFALVVAIATGTSLLTPFAHPVNVLVMGPGGYQFKDYLKAGFPLVLITFAVVLLALPLFWHL